MKELNLYKGSYKPFLLISAILFAVFAFIGFIYPGVPFGIDLKGGTMYIIRADQPMDNKVLEDTLKQNFPLSDLKIATITSPTAYGATIQYAENEILANAQGYVNDAKGLVETDPAQSISKSRQVFEYLTQQGYYTGPMPPEGLSAESMAQDADVALTKANENFDNKFISLISSTFNLKNPAYQKKEIGATLGQNFWDTAKLMIAVVFILITIIIFLFFREFIPSIIIMACAAFDVCATLAAMALFQIPLSLATIPAILMLVGYSVDTDILLTTRVLKRKDKDDRGRAMDAFNTGVTMTGTTLAAVTTMLIVSYFAQMVTVFELAAVLFFGLIADLAGTWLMNASILLWYVERRKKVR